MNRPVNMDNDCSLVAIDTLSISLLNHHRNMGEIVPGHPLLPSSWDSNGAKAGFMGMLLNLIGRPCILASMPANS